jgi:hypothetical protein
MTKYFNDLSKFIDNKSLIVKEEQVLSNNEKRLFRALKSMGERATKGRDIDRYIFEVVHKGGRVTLRMLLEGRHALSIGNHVAKRFVNMNELEFVDVIRTKKGAKVVLRPIGG